MPLGWPSTPMPPAWLNQLRRMLYKTKTEHSRNFLGRHGRKADLVVRGGHRQHLAGHSQAAHVLVVGLEHARMARLDLVVQDAACRSDADADGPKHMAIPS